MINVKKFKSKMIEHGYTQKELADDMAISAMSLTRKLSGTTEFTRAEISRVVYLLKLTPEDLLDIFFN